MPEKKWKHILGLCAEAILWACLFGVLSELVIVTMVLVGKKNFVLDSRGVEYPYPVMWEIGVAKILIAFSFVAALKTYLRRDALMTSVFALHVLLSYSFLVGVGLVSDPLGHSLWTFVFDEAWYLLVVASVIVFSGIAVRRTSLASIVVFAVAFIGLFYLESYNGPFDALMRRNSFLCSILISVLGFVLPSLVDLRVKQKDSVSD